MVNFKRKVLNDYLIDMIIYMNSQNKPQEKISCSLVLKLKVFKLLYFQVLPGALHTVYHESSSLF